MKRTPEPELMTDAEQVAAYAAADFEAPHSRYVELLRERLPRLPHIGTALDIGCGPGDITCRLARAFPAWQVLGIDGSEPMLEHARDLARRLGVEPRVDFRVCRLPASRATDAAYDLLCSNSLLHHLAEPMHLWHAVARWSHAESAVFVMDLLRPGSEAEAEALVEEYSKGEPEVLRHDFYNSLCAAYRPEEVREQLDRAGLKQLRVEAVSDRHWLVAS
jgi:ubiquinone/menaquinone biosynthesis C-methylase UbiE